MPTAGILIIGNEILSGKVTDVNSPYLCRELRTLGVDVERILTIPDEVDVIAREVRAMSEAYDFVFTSGGIGPTHDDLTMDGVAAAFGRRIERNDSIAARIERAQGHAPNESQLKMAMVPEGSKLVDAGDLWFPVVIVENVHVFPGIPELLRKKFESIRERFRGVPVLLKRVFVKQRESDIAHSLHELLAEFPQLMLGSYPRIGEEAFHVLLTLESRDAGYLQRALESLLERLPSEAVHRIEQAQPDRTGQDALAFWLAYLHPVWMLGTLALAAFAARTGLRMRTARRGRRGRDPRLRPRHVRAGKLAVSLLVPGFVLGSLSAVGLRGMDPFSTAHGWIATAALLLFAAVGALGLRLERRGARARLFDLHGALGLLALLAGAAAFFTGFVLLP